MSRILVLRSVCDNAKCYKEFMLRASFNFIVLCVLIFVCSRSSLCGSDVDAASFETLVQKAQQCRLRVDKLWQYHKQRPQKHRRDFHIAIGHASKHCDDLRDIVKQLSTAQALSEAYEKSFQEAQNLVSSTHDISQ